MALILTPSVLYSNPDSSRVIDTLTPGVGQLYKVISEDLIDKQQK